MSRNKTATQSTRYSIANNDWYKAGNAVDRDITTCMRTQPIGTNSPNQTVWRKVDLGGVYTIYSVNILFKTYHGHGIFLSDNYDKKIVLTNVMLNENCICFNVLRLIISPSKGNPFMKYLLNLFAKTPKTKPTHYL